MTNIEADALSVAGLHRRRYEVEFDVRDLKVTIDTENTRATRVDTIRKELLGSVIAYNLVAQLRKQAAKLINVAPRRASRRDHGVWVRRRSCLVRGETV